MADSFGILIPTKPHQRLQWRLVRSYMVVSAVTSTILGAGVALWMAYCLFWSPKITHDFETGMPPVVHSLERYFGREPGQVDRIGLQTWLDHAMQVIAADICMKPNPRLHVQFLDLSIGGGQAVVFGENGAILAASPEGRLRPDLTLDTAPQGLFQRNGSLLEQTTPGERAVFRAAWRGRCTARILDARLVSAAPVWVGGKIRAICCFRSEPVFTVQQETTALATSILPIVATVVVLSTLISGILGYMTAKRLTTRFSIIADVAASWARGTFGATAPETPEDELGLLGRHLNRMASDLQIFLGLRRALAAVEERNRIARDLHDTVKQQIFAAGLQVGAAQTRLEAGDIHGVARSLDELEVLLAQSRAEMATILQELRPMIPGDAGLFVEVVRQTVIAWSRQSGIASDFEHENITHVPASVATQLHRILQEALANVARHSRAHTVQVAFWQESGTFTLEINDSGAGFDLPATAGTGGMGLQTMRERADLLPGGDFEIDTKPGAGTRITVRCDAPVFADAGDAK